MTFTQKLSAAGFASKAEFARFVGYGERQVQRWKDAPPLWVHRLLDMRIKVMELGRIET